MITSSRCAAVNHLCEHRPMSFNRLNVVGAPCSPNGRTKYCHWLLAVLNAVFGFASGANETWQYPFIRLRVDTNQALLSHSTRLSSWGKGYLSKSDTCDGLAIYFDEQGGCFGEVTGM